LLVVEVTNNTVGHKIKITSSSILKKIRNSGSLKLKKIKVKITVQNPNPKRKVNKTSISSVNQMKNLSKKISDSPLKTYLKKIFQNK
jgi:hypothetical protein